MEESEKCDTSLGMTEEPVNEELELNVNILCSLYWHFI